VFVPMVEIGVVRVPVPDEFMPVPMRMGFRHRAFVRVSMMLIVHMTVFVLERLVLMLVAVPFGEMEP
jgi:hypothetical protein